MDCVSVHDVVCQESCRFDRILVVRRFSLSGRNGEIFNVKELHLTPQWLVRCLRKRPDTVGELESAENCVSHMPSWKAKKLGKRTQEKVLLEPFNKHRLINSLER
jgi:hypothetical protein